jgi:hypothetical protein
LSNSQVGKKTPSKGSRTGRTAKRRTSSTLNDWTDHAEEILKLQFKSIGEPFDPEFTKKPNWYQLKKSTDEQRNDFLAMFKEYMLKNKLATKQTVMIEYAYWDLQYGWTHAS